MLSELHERLAAEFWDEAGDASPYPRDLEAAVTAAKPITIAALPDLSVAQARQRLAHLPHTFGLDVADRRLNGCLVAYRGSASIFVEAALPPADRRIIVAHELAHFLGDYEYPRRRAERRVGPQLLRIFDGDRPATPTECLEATITGVELRAHVHCMERGTNGTYSEPTSRVEKHANDLGLELLAPWRDVTAALKARGPLPKAWEPWCEILESRYGLPASWAQPYAARLLAHSRARRSFSETLGL